MLLMILVKHASFKNLQACQKRVSLASRQIQAYTMIDGIPDISFNSFKTTGLKNVKLDTTNYCLGKTSISGVVIDVVMTS